MADSYAKRQMFFYGVEEQQLNMGGGNHQSTQQMMLMLENQSPKQVRIHDSSEETHGSRDKRLL